MLNIKIVSGLEKVLSESSIGDYSSLSSISCLRGERISLQVICSALVKPEGANFSKFWTPTLSGPLAPYATLREVRDVPAANNGRGTPDDDYITTSPRLIPDILAPIPYRGKLVVPPYCLRSLWIEIEVPRDFEASRSELTVTLDLNMRRGDTEPFSASAKIAIDVIDAALPEQELLFTQWFHSDCLASYYGLEKWSDAHFEVIERFARTAVKNGINMLYTPLISPPLDNEYDTRDLQLADVTVTDGGYEIGWEKLDRWIETLNRAGVKYFEIGHLFTQGGADRATKVSGYVGGEYKRLFPKETPCDDPEYVKFLRALLTSFLEHMKARGDDKRCYFHISDEPSGEQIATYTKAKSAVADILEGYVIMDALSHYEFYESGAVPKPVVILGRLNDFLVHNVEGLWCYNCCGPDNGYSNRFLSMTSARNRSIGLMLYKYNIEGFLHWGYNFYYNSGSADLINPFLDTTSGGIFPSGDAFSVYPGFDGEPIESMRLVSFNEAIEDIRAFRLCESLYSREETVGALEEELGQEIKPNTYINDSETMLRVRERINAMIKKKVQG